MDVESPLLRRFLMNMKRIGDLLALLKSEHKFESATIRGDIARTVVVFLHATFEDLLRSAARQRLDAGKWQNLNIIPLIGASTEKFKLGALSTHREKTVDQLIQESVEDYLNKRTFGSTDAVDQFLVEIGLDSEPLKHLYTELAQLMTCRHRIVHHADLRSPTDSTSPTWTSGDDFLLWIWWVAVMTFQAQLCVSLDPDPLQGWYAERRRKAIESFRQTCRDILSVEHRPDEEVLQLAQKIVGGLRDVVANIRGPSGVELRAIADQIESSNQEGV